MIARVASVAALLCLALIPASSAPALQEAGATLLAASDASGVVLRWNFVKAPSPEGGVRVFRRPEAGKDFVPVGTEPVKADPVALDKIVAQRTGRAPRAVALKTAEEKREHALFQTALAEADPECARAMGLLFADAGATPGAKYVYQLRAVDGTSVWATSAVVAAGQAAVVPKPVIASAASVAQGVTVRWGKLAGVSGYHVSRASAGAKPVRITKFPVVAAAEADTVASTDTAVRLGEACAYQVVAIDPWGRESAPAESAPLVHRDVVAPQPPRGLRITEEQGRFTIAWKAPADPDLAGFRVHRSARGAAPVLVARLPKTTLTHQDAPGEGDFAYCVTAFDTAGNESPLYADVDIRGALSRRLASPLVARTPDRAPPPVPANAKASVSGGTITLSWTAVQDGGLAGYAIYRASEPDGKWWKLGTSAQPSFVDRVSPFRPEDWYYRIASFDKAGNESARTATVVARVNTYAVRRLNGIPPAPVIAQHPSFPITLTEQQRAGLVAILFQRCKGDPYAANVAWEALPDLAPAATKFEDKTAGLNDGWIYRMALRDRETQTGWTILNPPNSSKTTNEGGVSRLDFNGASVTLDAPPPATGNVGGTMTLPYLDTPARVTAVFRGGAATDVQLEGPVTVTLPRTGVTLRITSLAFETTSAGARFIELDGSIEASLAGTAIASCAFTSLRITMDGRIEDTAGLGADVTLHGFPLRLTTLELGGTAARKAVSFSGRIEIAEVLPSAHLKVTFSDGAVALSKLRVSADLLGVSLNGDLTIASNSVSGAVAIRIDELGLGLQGQFVFGRAAGYSYFNVAVALDGVKIPIGSTGLEITGFSGGVAWNMAASVSGNRVTFAARKDSMSFTAGVSLASADGTALRGSFELTVGDTLIRFRGAATVIGSINASADIQWSDAGFFATCEVSANLAPLATVEATLEMKFGRRADDWYIAIGTQRDPCRASLLGGAIDGTFWLTVRPGEFRAGIGFAFDTGRMEVGPFWAEASCRISGSVTLTFGSWAITSFTLEIDGNARVAFGCGDIDFHVTIGTHGTVTLRSGDLTARGYVDVSATVCGERFSKRFWYSLRV